MVATVKLFSSQNKLHVKSLVSKAVSKYLENKKTGVFMFRLCMFAKETRTTAEEDIPSGCKKSSSLGELRGKNQ